MKTMKTDPQIQQDVLNELKWDTRVAPNEVGVEVDKGIVTLTGTVSSYAKKLAAEQAAHHVLGVLDVANDLAVKLANGAKPNDTEIAAAVRQALQWDVFVPEDKIQTTVSNGLVKLHGMVDYASQRHDAARAIQNLAGVCAIDNQLKVKRADVSKPALKAAIHDALERRAERDADRIQLEIDAGHVTLSGTVHSWTERQAVVGAAWGTHGVEIVVDKLHVSP
jgi:osmotically-inducible protein OsmY